MTVCLVEMNVEPIATAMQERLARMLAEGVRRARKIDCFDYIPSNAMMLYAHLNSLPRGRFCEWGSGMGLGLGIAAWLGFEAMGVELNPELAQASRDLLGEYQLKADVLTGSYYDTPCEADYYFVYCWPSQVRTVEPHFAAVAPAGAKLLICDGAEALRCKQVSHVPDTRL